ncbi:MAG: hypothetical protein QGG71_17135 [Pirellulaceae bacterium]|jgi:hypothetical protein|nr:hypothetical protein [Planctomycetaceae bacterium]MDP6556398.1 hypothetical protein [Pirellulaceae bacterium]
MNDRFRREIPTSEWLIFAVATVITFNIAVGDDGVAGSNWRTRLGTRDLVLVGDSGTQCVMQNVNIDYRSWIDDAAEAGVNAIHIWSFMAPRQTHDGKVVEQRYGYVYPGITPWKRHSGGPNARDGLPCWDLQEFDEGDDPNQHYWARLRDICSYAQKKNLLVGITVFFGWPKHQSDWEWHPFNVANGGHLADRGRLITAVQQIASPGQEVLDQPWSNSWSDAKKTQWLWERFAAKLLDETLPIGNTFYVFMDERSYSEGNCGDHFAEFFRRRGAYWIDGHLRRDKVDGVVGGHGQGRNINALAAKSLSNKPYRPFFEFELPPYQGPGVRHNLYACLLGGGHYFFHNDADQETHATGIMAYDSNVKDSQHAAVRTRLRWLGIACRLLNEHTDQLLEMTPRNDVLLDGKGHCLAAPRSRYLVYIREGGKATLRLGDAATDIAVTATNVRSGDSGRLKISPKGHRLHLEFTDQEDWFLVIQRKPLRTDKRAGGLKD